MYYICTADWHLRGDKPRCRLDEDWEQTQKNMIEFIFDLAADYKADIIHTGDLFDHPIEPDWLKYLFLDRVRRTRRDGFIPKIFLIAGNHELLYHNYQNMERSSFGLIYTSGNIHNLNEIGLGLHFGMPLQYDLRKCDKIFIHKLTYKDLIPPFVKDAITAPELLNIFDKSKWIITGDNHKRFVYEENGRYVINPGCIMRQTVDEIDYDPSVYLINFKTEQIKKINIPDNIEMVTDEYLIDSKDRDERIQSFVELIKGKSGLTLSFRETLLSKLKESNNELGSFKDIIFELMEEIYAEKKDLV